MSYFLLQKLRCWKALLCYSRSTSFLLFWKKMLHKSYEPVLHNSLVNAPSACMRELGSRKWNFILFLSVGRLAFSVAVSRQYLASGCCAEEAEDIRFPWGIRDGTQPPWAEGGVGMWLLFCWESGIRWFFARTERVMQLLQDKPVIMSRFES